MFTLDEISEMRMEAEGLMTDSVAILSSTKTAGDFGGFTSGAETAGDPFIGRLVSRRTGGEKEEERRIFAQVDWLLRYPWSVQLTEGMRLQVTRSVGSGSLPDDAQVYEVRAIAENRTQPHIQNLAGLIQIR